MFLGLAICALSFGQVTQDWTYSAGSPINFNGTARMALDPNGYVHICHTDQPNAVLLNPSGQTLWTVPLATQDELDSGMAVTYDSVGNTYVLNRMSSNQIFLRVSKVDLAGNIAYNNTLTLAQPIQVGSIYPTCMATAADGTTYIAGSYVLTPYGFENTFTMCLSPTGTVLWQKVWDGPLHYGDRAIKIFVRPDGGVVVGVAADDDGGSPQSRGHMAVLRYDASGNLLWSTVEASTERIEAAKDMDMSPNGDIALIADGWGYRTLSIRVLDADGNIKLFKRWKDGYNLVLAFKVRFDPAGNIIVGGGDSFPQLIQKWTQAGTLLWSHTFLGPVNTWDDILDMAVDPLGNVYVLGDNYFINDSTVYTQFMIIKFTADGALPWPSSGGNYYQGGYMVSPNVYGFPLNIAVNGQGGIYASGAMNSLGAYVVKLHEDCRVGVLKLSPQTVVGGGGSIGGVTLTVPSPAGGTTVNLSSDNPSAQLSTNALLFAAGQGIKTFNITAADPGTNKYDATITASIGQNSVQQVLHVLPSNNASFVNQTVPTSMVCGQTYLVTLNFLNTGHSTWTRGDGFQLQSANPYDNSIWGTKWIALANGPVAPGQLGRFVGYVYAPTVPGPYNFAWQVNMANIGHFGQLSPDTAITVSTAADAAKYVMQPLPATVNAGSDFSTPLTFKNVGLNTWSAAAGYRLVSDGPPLNTTWRVPYLTLGSPTVAAGNSYVFNGLFTAPIAPGTYIFRWSMEHGSTLFGDSIARTIQVVVGPFDDQFLGQSVPTSVGPGTTFNASLSFENLGTSTWNTNGISEWLKSQNPSANVTWGTAFVAVPGTVAQGSPVTINQTFTAPPNPGSYHFVWRMSQSTNGDTPAAFGQFSNDVLINVSADAAHFVSKTVPASVSAGATFPVSYTMQNTGTTTWSSANGYAFLALGSSAWGVSKVPLPAGSFAHGANVVLNFNATAPSIPGSYAMQYQMLSGNITFGEKTPVATITVNPVPYGAQFLSENGVPTTIAHGGQFAATLSFKNIGSSSWVVGTDLLGSQSPAGNSLWSVSTVPLPGTIAPGGVATFSKTFKAPNTPGTYHFRWRMKHSSTEFGDYSTDVVISVT